MADSEESELKEDLIVEILVRLPIKKIIQFKTVSKQWHRLISSDTFAFRQSQVQTFNHPSFFVIRVLLTNSFIVPVSLFGGRLTKHPQIDLPHNMGIPTNKGMELHALFPVGYGIYCLFEFFTGNVLLWNPTIKQTVVLPASPYYPSSIIHTYYFGTMDYKDGNFSYKVGRVASRTIKYIDPNRRIYGLSLELYSSETKSWKIIPDFSSGEYSGYADYTFHCANLNGKVHWVMQFDTEEDTYITTFDYETEVFGRIKAPSPLEVGGRYDNGKCVVTLFDDKFLCLVLFRIIDDDTWYLDIWVMRDYEVEDSWAREFTVGPIAHDMEVLGFSNKLQSVFLWHQDDSRFLLRDCKSSKMKRCGMTGWNCYDQHMQVVEHVESLVSVFK